MQREGDCSEIVGKMSYVCPGIRAKVGTWTAAFDKLCKRMPSLLITSLKRLLTAGRSTKKKSPLIICFQLLGMPYVLISASSVPNILHRLHASGIPCAINMIKTSLRQLSVSHVVLSLRSVIMHTCFVHCPEPWIPSTNATLPLRRSISPIVP